MLIYVARHAEAEHNLADTFHDVTLPDVQLTQTGLQQANNLALALAEVPFDAIYASELKRTQQTAEIVNIYHKVPTKVNELLNDIRSGIAGRPVSELRDAILASSDPWNLHFDNGESYNDVKARVKMFLKTLCQTDSSCVLVVTSGGIANIMYGLAHALSDKEAYTRSCPNAAVIKFDSKDISFA